MPFEGLDPKNYSRDAGVAQLSGQDGHGLLETETVGARIKVLEDALDEVFADHQRPDWDGYGAEAITEDALIAARSFLRLLPPWLAAPEVVAQSEGDIAFEWYVDPMHTLSVVVEEDGRLLYSGLCGPFQRTAQRDLLERGIPLGLMHWLRKFAQ